MLQIERYYFSAKSPLPICLLGAPAFSGPWTYFYSLEHSSKNVCYELEWKRGDSFLVFGFVSEIDQRVAYSPTNGSPFLSYREPSESLILETNPSFTLVPEIPAMVCISIKQGNFSIIQQKNGCSSTFPSSFKPNNVRILIYPGSQNKKDYINFNFGSFPFQNKIPEGYVSFSSSFSICSHIKSEINAFLSILTFILFLI